MDYDEIKVKVEEFLETQKSLLPSQKILKELFTILTKSKRYTDYCCEIKEISESHIEFILLADFFFLDCSVVFYEQSILKLAILLDDDNKTVNLEKFFNVLNSEDVKNLKSKLKVINKQIKKDRECLLKIRHDFDDFKSKRDKEIAHFDLSNIKKDFKVVLDVNSLLNIQSRTFDLIKKYFGLLDLPTPTDLIENNPFVLLTGLNALKNVSICGLADIDFSDYEKMQK